MDITQYLKALHKMISQLEDSLIHWALTGSLGLALQGVLVEVHDIELLLLELFPEAGEILEDLKLHITIQAPGQVSGERHEHRIGNGGITPRENSETQRLCTSRSDRLCQWKT